MDEEESNNNRPKEDKDADTELKDKSGIVLSPRPQAIIGAVPGVPVGTIFGNRIHLRFAGIHRPPMAGICGNPQRGAESIVLNSGYEDDVDEGDTIIYTGAGGNQGGKQVADQELTGTNAALVKSEELDLPVRVVRGSKLKSDFAAPYGFRYDGLYKVVEHYKTVGASGFAVWQFKMTRVPEQPELPGRMSEKERVVLAKKLKKQFEPILRDLRIIHMASDGESKVKSERGVKSEKKVKREIKRERDELDEFDGIDQELIQPRKRRRTIGGDLDGLVKQEKRRRGPGQPLPYQYRGYPGLKLATLPTWKLVSIILRGYCPLCVKLLFNCDVPVLHITQNNYLELASVLDHARLTKAINHLIEHQMYIKDLALHVEKNSEVDPLELFASQHIMNQMRVRSFIEGLEDGKDYSYILEAEKPVALLPQDEIPSPVASPLRTVNNEESVNVSKPQPAEDVQYLFTNDQNVSHDYFNEVDELIEKQADLLGSEPVRVQETPNKPKFTTEVINVIDDESDNNNNIVIVDGYTLFVSNKWDQNQLKKSAASTTKTTNNNKQPSTANTNNNIPSNSSRQVISNLSLYDVIVVDDDDDYAYQNKLIEEISSDEEAENTLRESNLHNRANGVPSAVPKKVQEKQTNGVNGSSNEMRSNGLTSPSNNNNTPKNNVNSTKSLFQLDNILMDDD